MPAKTSVTVTSQIAQCRSSYRINGELILDATCGRALHDGQERFLRGCESGREVKRDVAEG